MRLSTFTDYSLRMLIFVATAPEGRATIAEVARSFGISESHLVKVAHGLGRMGVLANTRGRGGGLRLALPAGEIVVGKVVRATEVSDIAAECFDPAHNTCAITRVCRLRSALAQALAAFYQVLDRHTLADLVANRGELAAVMHLHGGLNR